MSGIFAAVSAGAAVVGVGMQAAGSVKGGNASSAAAQSNAAASYFAAQVAQNNAIIAEQNATQESEIGLEQAGRKSMEGGAKMGLTRTIQAASGVDVNTGSAKDVQVSEREVNKLDAETVLSNAATKAYGYKVQAANFRNQANLDIAGGGRYSNEAAYDSTAGFLKGGATLLSSASLIPSRIFTGGGGGGDVNPVSPSQTGGGLGGTTYDPSTGGYVSTV